MSAHKDCNDFRHGFVMTKVYETEEMKISPQHPGNGFMKTTTKIEIYKDEPCQRCKYLTEKDRRDNGVR